MEYSHEKTITFDRFERQKYLHNYHKWLKQQREKDKEEYPYKYISTGQHYLKLNICPYCKKELDVQQQQNLIYKSCKKHGLLQIKKTRKGGKN